MEEIGLRGLFDTGDFDAGVKKYIDGLNQATSATQKAAGGISGFGGSVQSMASSVGSSSGILGSLASGLGGVATVALGMLSANVFGGLASGLREFVGVGVEAVSNQQTLEIGLQALLSQNNMYEQSTKTMTVAVGDFAKKQAEAAEKSDDLAFKQEELTAKIGRQNAAIQEQKQRIIQMADGLDKNTAIATLETMQVSLKGMQRDLTEAGAEQGKLSETTQEYTTVTKTSYEQVMNMADAQKLATSQSKELLSFVDKLSIVSPFEQEQVQQVTKYALAANMSVDQTKAFTAGFLDLASAVGIGTNELGFAADQLLQVKKTGKLTEIDLRQLRRLGIDLSKVIGVQMGMSVDQFNEKAKQSPEIFDDLFKAITDYSHNTFAGTSEKMASSLEGLNSTASDLFKVGAKNLLRPLIEAVTPAAAGILSTIADYVTGPQMAQVGKAIPEVLFGAFKTLQGGGGGDFLYGLRNLGLDPNMAKGVVDFTKGIRGIFDLLRTGDFKGGIFGLSEDSLPIDLLFKARNAVISLGDAASQIPALWSSLLDIGNPFSNLATAVGTMNIAEHLGLSPEVAGTITSVVLGIKDLGAEAYRLIMAFQTGGFTGLSQALGIPQEVIDGIATATDEFQKLTDVFTTGFDTGGVGGGLTAVFDSLKASVMTALPGLAASIMTGIPVILTELTTGIADFLAGPAIPQAFGEMKEWANAFWGWANQAIDGAGMAIGALLLSITAWVASPEAQTQLSSIGQSIGQGLMYAVGFLLEDSGQIGIILLKLTAGLLAATGVIVADLAAVGGQIVAGIVAGIINTFTGGDFQPAMVSELGGILTGIANDGYTIASVIGKRIVDGIKGGVHQGFSAISDLINSITTPFRDLGKAVQDEVGPPLLKLGEEVFPVISKGLDLISEAVKRLTDGWHALANAASQLGSSIPDVLMPGSPPPLAYAFWDIQKAAGDASQGINQFAAASTDYANVGNTLIQRIASGSMLKGGSIKTAIESQFGFGAKMFKGLNSDTDGPEGMLSEAERNRAEASIKKTYDTLYGSILKGTAGATDFTKMFHDQLVGAMNPAELKKVTKKVSAMAQDIVDGIRSQFGPMSTELKAQAVSLASSINGIGGSFAQIMQGQIDDFQKSGDEATKLGDKNKTLTETLTKQQVKMTDLQKDLARLTSAHKLDQDAIENKQRAIADLTAEMNKNQAAITDNQAAIGAHQQQLQQQSRGTGVEGDLATIELLKQFLASKDQLVSINKDILQDVGSGHMDFITQNFTWDKVEAQKQLNKLLEEQAKREEEIAKQQEAQKSLDFLNQQIELIKIGQQVGGNVFQGLTFGLDASVDDLLAATNQIVEAMVGQINEDLQIHSPSRVMEKLFRFVPLGAAKGILSGQGMVENAISQMTGAISGGSSTSNVYNSTSNSITVNMPGGPRGATPAYQALQVKQAFRYKLAGI